MKRRKISFFARCFATATIIPILFFGMIFFGDSILFGQTPEREDIVRPVTGRPETTLLAEFTERVESLEARKSDPGSDERPGIIRVAKPVHPSSVSADAGIRPSASEQSAMTKGKIAILGIRSVTQVESLRFPQDSLLVSVPTSNQTLPSKNSETTSKLSDVRFVCLLNHLSDDEKNLLADASDGRWDSVSFLDAVLIADGISNEERAVCRGIYDRRLAELRDGIQNVHDDLKKARLVYEFLHRTILTGAYSLNHSSAAVSLQTGVYNCVSATALFNALAGDVGLTSYGLEMTGHAKSRLICGDEYLDIETTCPNWDLLPDKPTPIAKTVRAARPSADASATDDSDLFSEDVTEDDITDEISEEDSVISQMTFVETAGDPRQNDVMDPSSKGDVFDSSAKTRAGRRPARTVTPVQFVATIYYNRAVDYYQEGRFDLAICAYLKAIAVDPNNKTVLGNFKATLNNLAIELASRNKNYAEAIRLTEQGLSLDPDFDQFKANLPLYYRHWSDDLRKENKMDEARRVEARFRRSFPQKEEKVF